MNIIIVGDFSPQDRVAQLFENNKTEAILSDVKLLLNKTDYSIVNFECAVVDNNNAKPIVKYGPCLSCPSAGVDYLNKIGFDCVTLANNHFRDFGNEGVKNSLKAFRDYGLDYVGGGLNLKESQRILFKEIRGKKLAFVNLCENEFSIATDERAGSAPLDLIANYNQIIKARNNADIVIVIVHGGSEGWQYPTPRMKKTYQWFVDIGADVVVNHHQHCFSGYEVYKEKPIFYGLGNFCFDEDGTRDCSWNYGFVLFLSIDDEIKFELIPYEQCNHKPEVRLLDEEEKAVFNKEIEDINNVISDDRLLNINYENFIKTKKGYLGIVSPYQNEYVRAAASRHWIPFFLPRKKMLNILNFIECESHRDIFIDVLKKQIYHD